MVLPRAVRSDPSERLLSVGLTRDEGKDGLSFLCLLKQALVDQKWQGCLEPECLHGEVFPCLEDRVFPTEARRGAAWVEGQDSSEWTAG